MIAVFNLLYINICWEYLEKIKAQLEVEWKFPPSVTDLMLS